MNKTIQRAAILNELRSCHRHPTADELYAVLRYKVPQISLGTIYRNLEEMSQRGVIRKLELAGRQKRFDPDPAPHYHLRCRRCDTLVDLHNAELDKAEMLFQELLEAIGGETVRVEFDGYCPRCREAIQQSQCQAQQSATAKTAAKAMAHA